MSVTIACGVNGVVEDVDVERAEELVLEAETVRELARATVLLVRVQAAVAAALADDAARATCPCERCGDL